MTATGPGAQRVTLAAVARLAGVSVSTASLAFSGHGPVAASTKDKVLAAAARLGYFGPDPLARSLRQGRSGVVGMLVENSVISAFRDPVNVGMTDGVAEVLGDAGAGVLLLTDAPHARGAFDHAAMDGMVLSGCSPLLAELLESLRRRRIPTVLLGSRARPGVPAVDVDNLGATRQLARRLAELGHRNVATVTLPLEPGCAEIVSPEVLDRATVDSAADRLRGFWAEFPGATAVAATDSTVAEGERLGRLLLGRDDRPTAVLAQSDLLAAGVIRAAEGIGLQVPSDLSVVGFDGIELHTVTAHRLTTMRQPMQDKGRAAARTVLKLIAGGRPRSTTLDCDYVPGTTIAPPA